MIHAVFDEAHAIALPGLAAHEIQLCEDLHGRIDIGAVLGQTVPTTYHYDLCGPRGFMQSMIAAKPPVASPKTKFITNFSGQQKHSKHPQRLGAISPITAPSL